MMPFMTTIATLVMVVLIVSFAVAVSAAVRGSSRQRPHGFGVSSRPQGPEVSSGQDKALEELRLRYARGEISREEFLQRKIDLE